MKSKLRGIATVALTWAALWALIGLVLAIIIGIVDPDSIDPGEEPVHIATILGTVGVISGAIFGTLVALAERRKTIAQLPLLRVVLWGVVGSAIFPLVTTMNNSVLANTCPLGALSAAASVALARHATLWRNWSL